MQIKSYLNMPAFLMRSITLFYLFIYTIIKEWAYKQTEGGARLLNAADLASFLA